MTHCSVECFTHWVGCRGACDLKLHPDSSYESLASAVTRCHIVSQEITPYHYITITTLHCTVCTKHEGSWIHAAFTIHKYCHQQAWTTTWLYHQTTHLHSAALQCWWAFYLCSCRRLFLYYMMGVCFGLWLLYPSVTVCCKVIGDIVLGISIFYCMVIWWTACQLDFTVWFALLSPLLSTGLFWLHACQWATF